MQERASTVSSSSCCPDVYKLGGRTLRRDPKNRDQKMTRDAAIALGLNFYLARYFADLDTL
ncbi:MAG: hypothetical protein DMG97_28030 [Acidobacteria bacterium]|nr:MAG: hypothetical protein DMG97_28030 [Acidobacteriota bacterium]PYV74390.1 MAG: hypothetical protein DMG96_20380 [Acidobacteriota bacterium]